MLRPNSAQRDFKKYMMKINHAKEAEKAHRAWKERHQQQRQQHQQLRRGPGGPARGGTVAGAGASIGTVNHRRPPAPISSAANVHAMAANSGIKRGLPSVSRPRSAGHGRAGVFPSEKAATASVLAGNSKAKIVVPTRYKQKTPKKPKLRLLGKAKSFSAPDVHGMIHSNGTPKAADGNRVGDAAGSAKKAKQKTKKVGAGSKKKVKRRTRKLPSTTDSKSDAGQKLTVAKLFNKVL